MGPSTTIKNEKNITPLIELFLDIRSTVS